MPYKKEVAEALRVLGLSGSEIATPDLIDKARRFIHLQRQIHEKQRENERYYERVSNFGGVMLSAFQQFAPPPRPVREVFEDALVEVHFPAAVKRSVLFRPGDVLLDFAFPLTRLCVTLDAFDEVQKETLERNGWKILHFTETQIRRDPLGCAWETLEEYAALKRAKARRRN